MLVILASATAHANPASIVPTIGPGTGANLRVEYDYEVDTAKKFGRAPLYELRPRLLGIRIIVEPQLVDAEQVNGELVGCEERAG